MAGTRGFIVDPLRQMYFHYIVPYYKISRFIKLKRNARVLNSLLRSLMHYLNMSPIVNTCMLFFPAAFKTMSIQDGFVNWKLKIITGLAASGSFWPAMHFLNYQFIPHYYRELFLDVLALFYGVYLSYLSNKAIPG